MFFFCVFFHKLFRIRDFRSRLNVQPSSSRRAAFEWVLALAAQTRESLAYAKGIVDESNGTCTVCREGISSLVIVGYSIGFFIGASYVP